MKKIKILQFPIANSYGGITHYALDNWHRLDKTKFYCDFATMSPKLDFADEIEKTGAKIFYLSCYPTQDEATFRKEFNAILDNGYDVVHLHTKQWKNFIVEEICKERGVKKVIVHSHSTRCDNNDDELRRQETEIHNRVKAEFTVDLATDFWACSSAAADWLFGPQIPRERIKIMHNAIDVDKFLFNEEIRQKKRRELGIDDDVFVIGNVGRLCYQKNQELLIRAYANAFGNNPKLNLLIVGEGPLRSEIELLIKDLGVEESVRILGLRYDTNELYQAFDLFALSSRFEGLPITLIEAQTAGLRCLINKTISPEAEISDNCVWVENNECSFAEAIRKTITIYRRSNMEKRIVREGYDIKNEIIKIGKEYSALRATTT